MKTRSNDKSLRGRRYQAGLPDSSKKTAKQCLHLMRQISSIASNLYGFASGHFKKIKLTKLLLPSQELTSIFILGLGIALIMVGSIATTQAYSYVAPVFISLGAGIVTVYISEGIRNMMATIPRQEAVRKIGLMHQDLIFYLCKHNQIDVETKEHPKRMHKNTSRETLNLFFVMSQLERLIIENDREFLCQLKEAQLNLVRQEFRNIEVKIDKLTSLYRSALIDRLFNQDLIKLVIQLEEVLETPSILSQGYSRNRPAADASIDSRDSIFRDPYPSMMFVPVDVKTKKNTEVVLSTTKITNYFQVLIFFTNTYGYSNNAILGFLKRRWVYNRTKTLNQNNIHENKDPGRRLAD